MTNNCNRFNAWDVFVPARNTTVRLIDTVFFTKDCDLAYVKNSLINHDGYSCNIIVRKHNSVDRI